MKILLLADLHYSLRQWDWLQGVAARFDLVVMAGDLLDIGSIVPPHAQGIVMRKYIERVAAAVPLLVCSGNHDLMDDPDGVRRASWLTRLRAPGLHVDGQSYRSGGLFFSILPWWEGDGARESAEELLVRHQAELGGDRWVWVLHSPPAGSTTAWTGRGDGGDAVARRWIERFQPYMVLSGHIHYAPFHAGGSWVDLVGKTRVFNSGRQAGAIPTFTVIDTVAGEATWVAAGEAERAMLDEPLVRRSLVSV